MDTATKQAGIAYEKLMLRALQTPVAARGTIADRRLYYLLYCIRSGADLRETGYARQFIEIRNNVAYALDKILTLELHQHEAIGIRRLCEELPHVYDEEHLVLLIERALNTTVRLGAEIAVLH